jgi:hypothetical protein
MATGDWIHAVVRKCSCPGKEHAQLMTDVDGKKTGNLSLMKASQAYPDALGVALVDAWSRAPALEHHVQSLEPVGQEGPEDDPWDNVGEASTAGVHEPMHQVDATDIDNPWLDVDEGKHGSTDCGPSDQAATRHLSKTDSDSTPWGDDDQGDNDQGSAFEDNPAAAMPSTESDDDPWAELVQPHKKARQV